MVSPVVASSKGKKKIGCQQKSKKKKSNMDLNKKANETEDSDTARGTNMMHRTYGNPYNKKPFHISYELYTIHPSVCLPV